MEDKRKEQIEALGMLAEYNDRVLKNIPILVKELSGERLEDTNKFINSIVSAINWEIEVVNLTMEVINEGKERVSKECINEKIIALGEAINAKDDERMAKAFEDMIPVLEGLGVAVKEVIA